MLDHISIGVRDVAKAKAFYDAALKPLGLTCLSADETSLGYGKEAARFWVNAAERPVPDDPKSGLHFCFTAPSRESFVAFHKAAMAHADATMGNRACARIMDHTTTRPSSMTPRATG
jgi:catechol 2,3-dioxygenase-like lactoylglutathione lyase family enzyme